MVLNAAMLVTDSLMYQLTSSMAVPIGVNKIAKRGQNINQRIKPDLAFMLIYTQRVLKKPAVLPYFCYLGRYPPMWKRVLGILLAYLDSCCFILLIQQHPSKLFGTMTFNFCKGF